MRHDADRERIERFLHDLGARLRTEHTIYLDLHAEPDSDELLWAVADLRGRLDLNVELTSPLQFIPEISGWRDRSPMAATHGRLHVRHFDDAAQALAKLARGFETDLADVDAMLDRGLVTPRGLRTTWERARVRAFRHPSLDVAGLERRLAAVDRDRRSE